MDFQTVNDFEHKMNDLNILDNCNNLDMEKNNMKYDYGRKDDHRVALKEFRKLLQDILEPHHDDSYLYKWLKARDFDIFKAEKMIRESFKFRKKMGSDTVLTKAYELPEVYQKHPVTTMIGYDRGNSPIRVVMLGICDSKGFCYSLRLVELMKLTIYILESDLAAIQEKKKKNQHVSEEKTTFIFDFTNFSLKNFYDKTVINCGIQLLKMYQDHYPETLKAAYLINVPSYFTWLFNIFKPFLNHVTLSKIKIYKDGYQEVLREVIDPKVLPAFMGGDRTDPDGNPKCHTLFNWNPKIHPSYYLKEGLHRGGSDDQTMKTTTIGQRSNFQVPVDVQVSGSILKWVFRTKDYNIRFGLFYRANGKSNTEEIFPVAGVDCQVIPEENEFVCQKTGTYLLHFDNSYSWMTAKQLWYKVELENVDIIQNNNK